MPVTEKKISRMGSKTPCKGNYREKKGILITFIKEHPGV